MGEILKTVFRFTILGRKFEALRKHSAGKRERRCFGEESPESILIQ